MKTIKDIVLEGVKKHLKIENPTLDTKIPGKTPMLLIELIRKDVTDIYGKNSITCGRSKLAKISDTPREMIDYFEKQIKNKQEINRR